MAYGTITTWTIDTADIEEQIETVQTSFLPSLRKLGAEQAFMMRTGQTEVAVVTVFPDEATRSAALDQINQIRARASSELAARLSGEMQGEVFA